MYWRTDNNENSQLVSNANQLTGFNETDDWWKNLRLIEKLSTGIDSNDIAIENILLFHCTYKEWMVIPVYDANYFFNKSGKVKWPLTAMHVVVLSMTE